MTHSQYINSAPMIDISFLCDFESFCFLEKHLYVSEKKDTKPEHELISFRRTSLTFVYMLPIGFIGYERNDCK